MNNEMEFKEFINKNGILKDNGENYATDTKLRRFKLISEFIKESEDEIYHINEPEKIKKILKMKKELIQKLSASNLKRGLEWYLTFLESKLIDFKLADEVSDTPLVEGAKKKIYVNAYERNKKSREKCIEYYGAICSICNFDFKNIYGSLGEGYIHVHHLTPLSEIQKEYEVNPIEDLRPVCPNCHAMLHKKIPAYSIEDIQNIIKNQKQ